MLIAIKCGFEFLLINTSDICWVINLNGLGETTYNNYGVLFVNAIKEFYNN